ncbi:MAG TPA: hypothetical protein VK059_14900 [Nocardioidaceae bacterium]|nr:hypothetical protein [Nocardioidaceae bacterium]
MSLVFYPKSHRYKLDGQWVTGVTSLIKGGLPAPALMYWSARTVAEYVADNAEDVDALRRMGRGPMVQALKEVPWQKRDTAAVRGTEVHDLAERLVNDESVDIPPHLDGYVQSCVRFLDTWQPKTILTERPVAHRAHQWAGKFDYLCELPDGRVILLDWKTTASGIYPETSYQLAAYSHAEFYIDENGDEHSLPEIHGTWAVHLRPDDYDVIPVKGDDAAYKEFRHIAFVAAAAKRAKGDKDTRGYVGLPLDPPDWSTAA